MCSNCHVCTNRTTSKNPHWASECWQLSRAASDCRRLLTLCQVQCYSNTAAIRTAGASLALGQPNSAFVDDLFDGEALAFGIWPLDFAVKEDSPRMLTRGSNACLPVQCSSAAPVISAAHWSSINTGWNMPLPCWSPAIQSQSQFFLSRPGAFLHSTY